MHYLRHLGLGGTEKTCQLFFEHANKDDFQVAIAFEKDGDRTRLEEFRRGAKVSGGKIFMVDSYGGTKDPQSASLQGCVNMFKPDILHVYRSGYPEFPVSQIEVPHVIETNVFGFISAEKIDRTLFMSKWLMNHALEKLGTIPPGHPIAQRFEFVNNPVEEPYSDNKIPGLDTNAIWLGRCGRPDNGIYNAINVNAANLLRKQGYDVRFLVVAPPSNMIDDLTRLEIPFKAIDPTTDPLVLSEFYNSIDIYAHSRADGETFGVNIAEAMMHRKPVVTHIAVPSNPQMGVFQSQTELVDDGVTGYVVENDVGAYTTALQRLIDQPDERERFGVRGLEKAMREYHVDACVHKLEKIYREVMK